MRARRTAGRLATAALLLLIFTPGAVHAWGGTGHRIVAHIAARRLNKTARAKVAEILLVSDSSNAGLLRSRMAEAAVWPDDVARDEYPQASPWHFIDLSLKYGPKDSPDPFLDPANAYGRLMKFLETLRAGKPDELEPGSDLKFVIHVAGDIHQPNHCATNQDRGGNCFFARLGKQRVKLHSFWDTGILARRLELDAAPAADELYESISEAEKIKLGGSAATPLAALLREWILESHKLALAEVYGRVKPPPPLLAFKKVKSDCSNAAKVIRNSHWEIDDDYVKASYDRIRVQLITAGVRLAVLLNRIWPEP